MRTARYLRSVGAPAGGAVGPWIKSPAHDLSRQAGANQGGCDEPMAQEEGEEREEGAVGEEGASESYSPALSDASFNHDTSPPSPSRAAFK